MNFLKLVKIGTYVVFLVICCEGWKSLKKSNKEKSNIWED